MNGMKIWKYIVDIKVRARDLALWSKVGAMVKNNNITAGNGRSWGLNL
jgi:hypothetical protein